jgi:hypothetical protein
MSRWMLWFLLGFVLSLILFAVAPSTVPAFDPSEKEREEVEALIRQLGSNSFETREAAARRLLEREDATAALQRAKSSEDREIARRATEILNEFGQREERRALARLADLTKNGEIDRAIEMLVRRKKWYAEDSSWQVMMDISNAVMEKGQKSFGKPAVPIHDDRFPIGDFRQYAKKGRVLSRLPALQETFIIP